MKIIFLFFETLTYLKPKQVWYQIKYRLYRPSLKNLSAPARSQEIQIIPPIPKYKRFDGKEFDFLNIKDGFHTWGQTEHGMLWAYNLNYMDWLGQANISFEECEKWIDRFIADMPSNHIGLDAYPTALRTINWIKFFCKYPECATKDRCDSLYSQVKLLERKLEWHIMGNHLLEDVFALFIASIYYSDNKLYKKASKLLKDQLNEQILPDGAHYEQSPMYHCILLDRLLDCVNFSLNTDDVCITDYLKDVAKKMLGHLESIIWEDGSIPLLNDSAYGIAPTSNELFDYAKRLGLEWQSIPMKECGYRKMKNNQFEVIVDVGNITARYQPAHSHADTLSYELRVDGRPLIIDTGISTYEDNTDRAYSRSTKAHNTVSVNDKNSSHVWKAFRVGKRAKVRIIEDGPNVIMAEHDGFNKCLHRRKFYWDEDNFCIEDFVEPEEEAVSYIHLAPGVKASMDENQTFFIYFDDRPVMVEGSQNIIIQKQKASSRYNQMEEIDVLAISFKGHLKYTIAGLA